MDLKNISPQIAEVANHYRFHKPPAVLLFLQDLLAAILRAIKDLLSSFHIVLPGLVDSRYISNLMQLLLYLCGCAATVILLSVILSRARHIHRRNTLAWPSGITTQLPLDASGWQRQAALLAASGNWGGACRSIYLSYINMLHEKGVLVFIPARSNYEYWQELSHHRHIQEEFKQICQVVEDIWFGGSASTQGDYDFCLEKLQAAGKEIGSLAPSASEKPA